MSALLIAVPELSAFTDRWRSVSYSSHRPHTPLSALVPPHVTLLFPWVDEPTPEHGQRLIEALAPIEPFELTFRAADRFANGTAWLRPEPYDAVLALVEAVVAAFPECPPYAGRHPGTHPHLSISSSVHGGDRVVAEAQQALADDPPPAVLVDDVTSWREGDNGVWRLTGSVPLGGARG